MEGWKIESHPLRTQTLKAVIDLEGCSPGEETVSDHRSAVVLSRFGIQLEGVAGDALVIEANTVLCWHWRSSGRRNRLPSKFFARLGRSLRDTLGTGSEIGMVAEFIFEFFDFVRASGRNTKVVQASLVPGAKVVTSIRPNLEIDLPGLHRPDEYIDNLVAVSINDRRNRALLQHVDSTANQRVTFPSQIRNGRRIIELTGKPGSYDVLVARSYIDQMINHEGACMVCDSLGD